MEYLQMCFSIMYAHKLLHSSYMLRRYCVDCVYLTAVRLTPGDSITVHIYIQTTHRIQRTEHS
jgi:hypothetical protein